jgi:hypothetical protein
MNECPEPTGTVYVPSGLADALDAGLAAGLASRCPGPAGPPEPARRDQLGEGGVLNYCTPTERTH